MSALKIILFFTISIGLIVFSRKSLINPRSHGFYRFFSFEVILTLLLLNVNHWFDNPLSGFQIISWVTFSVSIYLAGYGFYLLLSRGHPEHGIEDTQELVIQGIYRYIRHPLYTSLILLGMGIFFKQPSLTNGALVILNSAFLYGASKVEEEENVQRFGTAYLEYMKSTKMFIPFLF
jgi:protein-S-isoprenylcysteine O-methyltransferase Ste14